MTTTLTAPTLSAEERCDRCGAQAYVRVLLPGGADLQFCGHHWWNRYWQDRAFWTIWRKGKGSFHWRHTIPGTRC